MSNMDIKHMVREVDETIDFLMTCDLDNIIDPVSIVVCGDTENVGNAGIHLIEPTAEQIERAWQDAHATGHSVVWCHYAKVKQFKKKGK